MKKDYLFSLIAGFLTSLFLIFIIKNPFIREVQGFSVLGKIVWYLPILFSVLFVFGFWFGKIIARKILVILQIVKFVEIGVLNTFMDFGILNLLIWMTGITSGWKIALINTASFTCAVVNSYFWNKYWTFETREGKAERQFLQFLIVSVIGWTLNTGIVFLGTTFISPIFGISGGLWANLIKILATGASMVWNFIGYKFWVFKPKEQIKQSNYGEPRSV